MMETITQTKRCTRCGQEKPSSDFYARAASPDGLQPQCKECMRKYYKDTIPTGDPELANYTPRELIAELRKRGYKGELQFVQIIKV